MEHIPEHDRELPENDRAYRKRRRLSSILSVVVFTAVFAAATAVLWKPLFGTFQNPEQFREWVDSNRMLGRLAMAGIAALQVVFAVLPGEPVEIGAGYAFSTFEGTALCLLGDAVGSTAVFLITRLLGVRLVEALISREKLRSLRFLHESRNLNLLVFLLFFLPGTPKDILTYFIGLTPMSLSTFLLITSAARIPSVLTSVITGNALGVQDYRFAIILYAVVGAVSLAGLLIYRRITSRHGKP